MTAFETLLSNDFNNNPSVPVAIEPTAAEQVRKAYPFNVDKRPLQGPDGLPTPFYGLFRDDDDRIVSGSMAVTKKYNPHQTDDVIALVEAAQESFGSDVKVRCGFGGGHQVDVMPTNSKRLAVYGTKDNLFPRLIINAGYDGKAFKATLGFYRDACSNLQWLRTVNATSVKITHTSGLRSKMEDLIRTFQMLQDSWDSIEAAVDHMNTKRVNMAQFLNSIYGEPSDAGRSRTIHKNRTEAIIRRLQRENYETGRDTSSLIDISAWSAYTAVQGYVQHDATRRGNPTDLSRAMMANNDAAVLKAETIAMDEPVELLAN